MTPSGLPALAAVLGFSPEELMLNRAGRISERQRVLLVRARRSGLLGLMCGGALLVTLVAGVLLVLPKLNPRNAGEGAVQTGPIVVGLIAAAVAVVTVGLVRNRRSLARLASGMVLAASGPAQVRVPGRDDPAGARYELTIGPTTFVVAGPGVPAAFVEGAPYRAYYATGSGRALNRILSVEPLS